jgi:hypothetical protein
MSTRAMPNQNGTITNNKESRGLLAVQESINHGVLECRRPAELAFWDKIFVI